MLSLMLILHDDVGFNSDPILKNLMNVGGYLAFESGATMIMCEPHLLPTHHLYMLLTIHTIYMTMKPREPSLIRRRSLPCLPAAY